MRSRLVVFKQPIRLQGIKDALRFLRLDAQLESYLVDWREDAAICGRQTPEIDQRLEKGRIESLYLRVIDKIIVDTEPASHDAARHLVLASAAMSGRARGFSRNRICHANRAGLRNRGEAEHAVPGSQSGGLDAQDRASGRAWVARQQNSLGCCPGSCRRGAGVSICGVGQSVRRFGLLVRWKAFCRGCRYGGGSSGEASPRFGAPPDRRWSCFGQNRIE